MSNVTPGDIMSAVATGDTGALSDWSSGNVPGSNITSSEPESSVSTFDTYLQSLEKPEEEAAPTPTPSTDAPPEVEAEATAEAKDEQPAKEEFFVTGPDGRKVKVVADYSDRDQIKKAYEQAAGMRKFQAERDAKTAAYAKLESEHAPLKETWSKFEQAWQLGGMEGVVDLIAGKQGAFKSELEKYANATPDERIQMERQLADEKVRRAETQRQAEIDQKLKMVDERLAMADEKETRALVTPAFQKHRFAGQLGDSVAEQHLDKAVWAEALDRLDKYEGEITAEVVDQTFEEISSALRRATKVQAERTIKKTVEKKKEEASTQVAAAAMKGMQKDTQAQSLTQRLWNGDSVGVLSELFRGSRR